MSAGRSLDEWLTYVETQHHRSIDLGLDRVRAVAARLGCAPARSVVVVGGTNGKGSTCAYLEQIYLAGGYRVGKYASPHLLKFAERIRIQGVPVQADDLIPSFERVEAAREGCGLTYFEFTTLVAMDAFARSNLDLAILEVGLGGRLDAVNIVDADCSILTTVGLDHQEWLGPTREAIGWEKAHIFRPHRPAICVDPDPPSTVVDYASRIEAQLFCIGRDYQARPATGMEAAGGASRRQWDYLGWAPEARRSSLPYPSLRGPHQLRNAAGALAAVQALAERLPVDQAAVRSGLTRTVLAGRFQVLPGTPAIILDVAHNPHAAQALAEALREHGSGPEGRSRGRTIAVFGMLKDKDAAGVIAALFEVIDAWHLCPTPGERGSGAAELAQVLHRVAGQAGIAVPVTSQSSMADALACARGEAGPDDRIVVFGSFTVVADAMRCLEISAR